MYLVGLIIIYLGECMIMLLMAMPRVYAPQEADSVLMMDTDTDRVCNDTRRAGPCDSQVPVTLALNVT